MWQDGFRDRGNFFQQAIPLVKEFSSDEKIDIFLDSYRNDYPSDYVIIFRFLVELVTSKIDNQEKMIENIPKIIRMIGYNFNFFYSDYINEYVEQLSNILTFLLSSNIKDQIENNSEQFQNIFYTHYLNENYIRFFVYFALITVRDIIEENDLINCVNVTFLSKMADGIAVLEDKLQDFYEMLNLQPGEDWYFYGE